MIPEFMSRIRLCAESSDPRASFEFYVSLSLCPSPAHALPLSKLINIKIKEPYSPFNTCRKEHLQSTASVHACNPHKVGLEETYINVIKVNYKNPAVIINLNGENLSAFPVRSWRRQGCFLIPLLVNKFLEVLATSSRQTKRNDLQITWHYI